jgi:molecular chaperone HtpG
MFTDVREKSVQLYSSKVFINDDAKELLPEYLRFVKGVVDTEDLPLNVSREVTQSSPAMSKIKQVLTKRILSWLEELSEKEKEKFRKFYDNFSPLFKSGINSDFANKDRLVELLRFESTKTKDNDYTSLNGYVSRMNEDQKKIYYISGNSKEIIFNNPNLEYFKEKDIEVIYLTDPVDVFTIPYVQEYDGKKIVSIEKADIELDNKDDESSLKGDPAASLIKLFKDRLGDKVEDVIESKRLVNSAATLVVGKEGVDPHMEKMMQMMDKNYSGSKRILEINMSHPLIKNLSSLSIVNDNIELIHKSIDQIYEGALLIEGQLSDPTEFVKRMTDLITLATKS